jgi:hypothetical protein
MSTVTPATPASTGAPSPLDAVLERIARLEERQAELEQRQAALELAAELLGMTVTVARQDAERDFAALGAAVTQVMRRTQ